MNLTNQIWEYLQDSYSWTWDDELVLGLRVHQILMENPGLLQSEVKKVLSCPSCRTAGGMERVALAGWVDFPLVHQGLAYLAYLAPDLVVHLEKEIKIYNIHLLIHVK
jgi:hypothetical protein